MPAKKATATKAPAETHALAIALPLPSDLADMGDPAFSVARRHAAIAKASAHLVVGANVALGAELARLRKKIRPSAGQPKRISNHVANSFGLADATPWRDLVKAHAGVNHETCRRSEKIADDLLRNLQGKRDEDSKKARRLLLDPSLCRDLADYATLAKVAGAIYDADSWTAVLVEAGVLRPSISQIAAQTGRGQRTDAEPVPLDVEARIHALGFLRALRSETAHRELWRQRLAVLPLDSTGDPDSPSLADLRSELNDRLTEVDQIIAHKAAV